MEKRVCKTCLVEKDLETEFKTCKSWNVNGTQYYLRNCRECEKINSRNINKKYRTKNKKKIKAFNKKYRENNKQKIKRINRKYYKQKSADNSFRKSERKRQKKYMKSKNERRRKKIKEVHPTYAMACLYLAAKKRGIFLPQRDMPQEMIALKQEQILLTRLIKEAKNGIANHRNQ